MASSVCRWGILGTAGIARKNWKAIWHVPQATLVGVASRAVESARSFIDACQSEAPFANSPTAYGSYDALLNDPHVDAVYIPLPTGIRHEWILKAAAAGKHVLAEKPAAISADVLRNILATCAQHGVQYMDGVMFMHSARLPAVRRFLDDGRSVGTLRRITSHHQFAAPPEFFDSNIRTDCRLEPHGALGDVGWYSIRAILWALHWQLPKRVQATIHQSHRRADRDDAVPLAFSAEMSFDHGVSAHFYCSFITENQQWVNFGGDKGFLQIPDFVLPFFGCQLEFSITQAAYKMVGCDFNMERRETRHVVDEYSNSHVTSQETRMFETFSELVRHGRLDPSWGMIALRTQEVLDACWQSAKESRPIELASSTT